MAAPNGRISSDLEDLAVLNAEYPWIPVRPTPEQVEKKQYHLAYVKQTFTTEADFVLKQTLGLPSKRVRGLHLVDKTNMPPKKAFVENLFPYQISGKHYVMWYTYQPPEEQVTQDIREALQELGHANAPFVWYENPRMTIPEVYHVQVFWSDTY